MLSVPEALPNDPEGVVTALEAAQIFGQQGDIKEAVRWVRRAAEIAGDEGSDERALTLARAVADLNISASQPPQAPPAQAEAPAPAAPVEAQPVATQPEPQPALAASTAEQAPPPPPLPAAGASSYDPDGDAETRVVESAHMLADFQKQTNGNGAPHGASAVPAPGLSPVATPVATPAEMVTPRAPQTFQDELPPPPPPPPLEASVDTAPEATQDLDEGSVPPHVHVSSMAELLARKEAEVSSARAAADATEPAEDSWDEPPPPPPQPSTPPVERRTAHPAAERVNTPLIPSQPYLERAPVNAPLHQAVRASVVATAEPGVFVLRVLTASQAPAPTGHEVLVVVTNPLSSPFK
jgi:hypothetical protein